VNDRVRELLHLLERHDPWEREHAERVAVYAVATAHRLGYRGEDLVAIRWAAELHDIGKLALREGEPISRHPAKAAAFLDGFPDSVRVTVLRHHERLDGSGYPEGRQGLEVPRAAQIVGLAEWFDVARHGAPFATGRSLEAVAAELTEQADRWFARDAVEALLAVQRVIQPVGT
jgi:putative nucleotidyltransferase with HDIG domain